MDPITKGRSTQKTQFALPPVAAFALDVGLVLVFAAVGAKSHDQALDAVGILVIGWPFLVGTTIGWALAWKVRKVPPISAHDGVLVWLATFSIGLLLRALSGAGTAVTFMVVTMVATAVLLLGWRFVADQVVSRRR